MKICIKLSCLYYLFFLNIIVANPSSYDSSFSNNGSTTNLYIASTVNQAQDIIAQPDGKIVTVGSAGENGIIVRYNNDGSTDLTFNSLKTPGYIDIQLGTQTALFSVILEPTNGKIIAVGYATIAGVYNTFIARYNRNGTIDTTFNGTGYILSLFQTQSQLYGVALQTNGSIVVAGWATENGLSQALVARYTNNGVLDTTFNGIGYVTTLIGGVFTKAQDLVIQADGKIVITGQAQVDGNQGLIVIRYNTDGSLDETFNSTGDNPGSISPLQDFVTSQGNSLTMQLNGKVVIVGYINADDFTTANRSYTVLRLNSDGTVDDTFNGIGYVINEQALQAQGVVMQLNGQIITCGFNYTTLYVPVIIRYNNDGTVDPTFNFTINQNTANSLGNAVALQIDGKIIMTGTIQVPYQQSAQ
ncbi:hypothetical protein KBC04_05460 [Candidatus Babeliales bacterium]|nr:hypothetical protein [Candidatus Babeliales bacterium]MBP9844255.1 hypothetical protein [Candidatus Babeliales bacterium]